MSLDGLRAWIGLVERRLTMRTRVFLVLAAIAIGGAAAGIYLAVEAQNDAVTEGDLQAVRDELAGSSPTGEGAEAVQLEAEIQTLRGEVAALRNEVSAAGKEPGGAEKPSGGVEGEAGKGSGGVAPPAK